MRISRWSSSSLSYSFLWRIVFNWSLKKGFIFSFSSLHHLSILLLVKGPKMTESTGSLRTPSQSVRAVCIVAILPVSLPLSTLINFGSFLVLGPIETNRKRVHTYRLHQYTRPISYKNRWPRRRRSVLLFGFYYGFQPQNMRFTCFTWSTVQINLSEKVHALEISCSCTKSNDGFLTKKTVWYEGDKTLICDAFQYLRVFF